MVSCTGLCVCATILFFILPLVQMTAAQVEYVSRVVQVSSEATSSQNIIGSPDVYPNYGANLPGAWSPIISGSHQFIEVQKYMRIIIKAFIYLCRLNLRKLLKQVQLRSMRLIMVVV